MNKDKTISQNVLENSISIYANIYYTISLFEAVGFNIEPDSENENSIPNIIYDSATKALDNIFMLVVNEKKILHPTENLLAGLEEAIQSYCDATAISEFDAGEVVDALYCIIDDFTPVEKEESQG